MAGITGSFFFAIPHQIWARGRTRSRLVDHRGARNGFAVRVASCVIESFLELPDNVLTEDMFNFFGVLVHVVRGDLGRIGEIKLPEAVVADDGGGALHACRGEEHKVAFVVSGGKAVSDEVGGLGG